MKHIPPPTPQKKHKISGKTTNLTYTKNQKLETVVVAFATAPIIYLVTQLYFPDFLLTHSIRNISNEISQKKIWELGLAY